MLAYSYSYDYGYLLEIWKLTKDIIKIGLYYVLIVQNYDCQELKGNY